MALPLAAEAMKAVGGGVGDAVAAIAAPSQSAAATIGQLGEAAAGVSPVLGEMTKALSVVMTAFDKAAEHYGQYSPQIAQAQAMAEVRQTMGDLRRAQEIGPDMARYVQSQSEMQQKFEDIKIKLLMQIVPVVTGILETVEAVMPSGQGIENAIKMLMTPLTAIPGVLGLMNQTMRDEARPPPDDPTSQLFGRGFDETSTSGRVLRPAGFVPEL